MAKEKLNYISHTKTIYQIQQEEIERLRVLCFRESEVLREALKRKNNKSMIKVVAATLAEQVTKTAGG